MSASPRTEMGIEIVLSLWGERCSPMNDSAQSRVFRLPQFTNPRVFPRVRNAFERTIFCAFAIPGSDEASNKIANAERKLLPCTAQGIIRKLGTTPGPYGLHVAPAFGMLSLQGVYRADRAASGAYRLRFAARSTERLLRHPRLAFRRVCPIITLNRKFS